MSHSLEMCQRQGRPRVSNSLGHDPFDVVHVRIRRGVVSDMMCCVSGYSLFYARARRAPTVIPGVLGKGCKSQDTRFWWSFPFVRSWLFFSRFVPVFSSIMTSCFPSYYISVCSFSSSMSSASCLVSFALHLLSCPALSIHAFVRLFLSSLGGWAVGRLGVATGVLFDVLFSVGWLKSFFVKTKN